ncbi:hypothetical protein [Nocardiopsis algeriensis]|uniref:Thioesterase superfamily protein n=1 Tax=Nocardiopsis algeriensis TaxID=1478215 RepID=A0A841IVG6_9ACTN|nr:hypothetical protein [Nocardiopsis algeriensis]MBB6121256.1 hypothetical protein [Nocardiopsis algeriensis]
MDVVPSHSASSLTIPPTHNGPDGSGNGGYSAGLLAALLTSVGGPAVQVTLRVPPPLGRPLAVEEGRDGASLTDPESGQLVAEAAVVPVPEGSAVPTGPVGAEEAAEAEKRYPGLTRHPFPRCYSCGTERAEGEGLRLFPGTVRPGQEPEGVGRTVACTWTPHPGLDDGTGHVGLPDTWAALDCPGGWSSGIDGRPAVLGRITVQVVGAPRIGHPHVVTGHLESVDGRKLRTGSALHGADGRLLAQAWATWIALRR